MKKIFILIIEKVIIKLYQLIGIGTYNSIISEVHAVKKVIPEIKSFVDCGANIGDYSFAVIKAYNPDYIFAFEPSKKNFNLLCNRFSDNSNVKIENLALSDKKDTAKLFYNFSGSGLASLTKRNLNHRQIQFSNEEEIQIIRLDDYWNLNFHFEYLDFLKIDVEGHELNVLNGLGVKITNVKVIQFEFGGCNIDTKTSFLDFWTFFTSYNFQVFRISAIGLIPINIYKEIYESYTTTNYVCVNKNFKNGE